ncbi:uncharacterized protein LOC113518404 [Galleria mellonella]|uniref:Uncharacterized protein LOC113518404 n=1 Tax=Galleria mellonella TaxID=7137 RepID=A0A6J1WU34_GALME|nr:uncharacterized protein LOC113518404 [Galleria mellonella]
MNDQLELLFNKMKLEMQNQKNHVEHFITNAVAVKIEEKVSDFIDQNTSYASKVQETNLSRIYQNTDMLDERNMNKMDNTTLMDNKNIVVFQKDIIHSNDNIVEEINTEEIKDINDNNSPTSSFSSKQNVSRRRHRNTRQSQGTIKYMKPDPSVNKVFREKRKIDFYSKDRTETMVLHIDLEKFKEVIKYAFVRPEPEHSLFTP